MIKNFKNFLFITFLFSIASCEQETLNPDPINPVETTTTTTDETTDTDSSSDSSDSSSSSSSSSSISINDPLFEYAWHLENTAQSTFSLASGEAGNDAKLIDLINAGASGEDVKIAISDSGIEHTHEDLFENYISGVSKNFYNSSPYSGDPEPDYDNESDSHGTAVTGIASAVGGNSLGSRGVAPNSKFSGFNFLANGISQSVDMTLYQMEGDFDIFNYSYGVTPIIYYPISFNTTERQSIIDAYETNVNTLRDGKGAIYVKSAGNDYAINTSTYYSGTWQSYILGNATLTEDNNLPYTIIVGAVNALGESSSYSTPGSNLWISAQGGEFGIDNPAIITTDFEGCDKGQSNSSNTLNSFENNDNGLNDNCNYTSIMNGTSSAAPIISGVIALMLEANPDLTWRDVKHILASTAYISNLNTSTIHPGGRNLSGHAYMNGWKKNAAGYWFHNWFGFGVVNAESAVEMAKDYNIVFSEFKQTINSIDDSWIYDSGDLTQNIPNKNKNGTTHTLSVTENYTIESVQVTFSANHEYAENLGVELTSPSGTTSKLILINSGILQYDYENALITSNAFYGESSSGNWTIKVIDGSDENPDGTSGTDGTFLGWKLNIMGHESSSIQTNSIASSPILIQKNNNSLPARDIASTSNVKENNASHVEIQKISQSKNDDKMSLNKTLKNLKAQDSQINKIISLNDKSTLILGKWKSNGLNNGKAFVMKLLDNGLVDISFAENGIVFFEKGELEITLSEVVINRSDEIFILAKYENKSDRPLLIKLTPKGIIDNDFGTHGLLEFSSDNFVQIKNCEISVLENGKLNLNCLFNQENKKAISLILDPNSGNLN